MVFMMRPVRHTLSVLDLRESEARFFCMRWKIKASMYPVVLHVLPTIRRSVGAATRRLAVPATRRPAGPAARRSKLPATHRPAATVTPVFVQPIYPKHTAGRNPPWRSKSLRTSGRRRRKWGPEVLWDRFRKHYPKMQAFDSPGTAEILTIRPQDIGLLPRENWGYGNNSFSFTAIITTAI